MAMSKPVILDPEQSAFDLVAAGRDPPAVVDGIRLLKARERRLAASRDAWCEGAAITKPPTRFSMTRFSMTWPPMTARG
ncbi:MAG: hypothetical protein PGN25_15275 [Methylorubrum populi]